MALTHNSADLVHIPKFDITVANAANPYGALESAQLTLKGRLITPSHTVFTLRTPPPPPPPPPPKKPFMFMKKLMVDENEFEPTFDGQEAFMDGVNNEIFILPVYSTRKIILRMRSFLLVQENDTSYRRIGMCTADCKPSFQSLLDTFDEQEMCLV